MPKTTFRLTHTAVAFVAIMGATTPLAAQYLPGQYVPPGAYVPPGTLQQPTGPLGPPPGFPVPRSTAPSTITPDQARPAPLRTEPIPERRPSSRLLLREYEPLVQGLNRRECLEAYDASLGVSRSDWRRLCNR